MGMTPERDGKQVAQRIEASEGGANLSVDGMERGLQRPVNRDKEKEKYSGREENAYGQKSIVGK